MFLDPALKKTKGTPLEKVAVILKQYAAKVQTNTLMVNLVAQRQSSVLGAGLSGAKLMAELLTDPLVQQVIKEGISIVPNILNAYAKDGTHGAALWLEMLKQIKAIHDHSTDPNQEKQEFKDWLSGYLRPEGPAAAAAAAPEITVEEPAEGEQLHAADATEEE